MSTIQSLLKKAQTADAPPLQRSGKWGYVMPVIRALMMRGYRIGDAVDWCVAEGAIPLLSRRTAYYAISNRLRREATRAAKP